MTVALLPDDEVSHVEVLAVDEEGVPSRAQGQLLHRRDVVMQNLRNRKRCFPEATDKAASGTSSSRAAAVPSALPARCAQPAAAAELVCAVYQTHRINTRTVHPAARPQRAAVRDWRVASLCPPPIPTANLVCHSHLPLELTKLANFSADSALLEAVNSGLAGWYIELQTRN